MIRLSALLAVLAIAAPAAAQDAGGLPLAPEWLKNGGPTGLAKPLPFVFPSIGASDVQAASKATDRTSRHQALIARVRGDAGYLGGFQLGTPLSASVQRPVAVDGFDPGFGGFGIGGFHVHRPVVVNNTFDGPVAITSGTGNTVQVQSAVGSGPIALQQVTTQGLSGGGAVNAVLPGGNIVQRGGR